MAPGLCRSFLGVFVGFSFPFVGESVEREPFRQLVSGKLSSRTAIKRAKLDCVLGEQREKKTSPSAFASFSIIPTSWPGLRAL